MNQTLWRSLGFPICENTYSISSNGDIRYNMTGITISQIHHSTNGYDYVSLLLHPDFIAANKNIYKSNTMYFRLDLLVARYFVPVPSNLAHCRIDVEHIDGDKSNYVVDNLKWVEDVELWRPIKKPELYGSMYEVSNFGNVRSTSSGELIPSYIDKSGYKAVQLKTALNSRKTSGLRNYRIHNLLAPAFYEVASDSERVNIINGVKTACELKNLEMIASHYTSCTEPKNPGVSNSNYSNELLDIIRDLLIKCKGCNKDVYELIDKEKYPFVTLGVIGSIKQNRPSYRRSNKYTPEELDHLIEINSTPYIGKDAEHLDRLRDLLTKYDGDVNKTFKDAECDVSCTTLYNIKNGKYNYSNKYNLDMNEGLYPFTLKWI